MPAQDAIHNAVKNALVKDGWTITAEPFTIRCEGLKVFADLAAKRTSPARQEEWRIVVEIKSFSSPSAIHDLEVALGQYVLYRNFLRLAALGYELYLAIGQEVYAELFTQGPVQFITQHEHLQLVVINLEAEEVVSWIS